MKNQKIIIIGSGLAGYSVAKEFRKLNKEAQLTIITAQDGRFYSKPLLSTALANRKTADNLGIYTASEMSQQLNAKIYSHTPVLDIDRENQRVITKKKSFDYDSLVLACGSETITLDIRGSGVEKIVAVNDLEAYAVFRNWLRHKKRIAILGAGLVGCEFMNDLLNTEVSLAIIAPDDYPLKRFLVQPIAQVFQQYYADLGVSWHLGQSAVSVDVVNDAMQVTISNGHRLPVEGVFSAVGIRPVTKLAKKTGLAVNRAIIVDRSLRTSDPKIYSLGDCAEVMGHLKQYVAPLLQCARAVAKNLNSIDDQVQYPAMPVVIKTSKFPIVAYPPPTEVKGRWTVEGEGVDFKALCVANDNQLLGFALTGKYTRERMPLIAKIPPVFSDTSVKR